MAPQPFPGIYSTPSTALPTESTTNLEDSFCKRSYIDSPDNLSFSGRDNPFQQTLMRLSFQGAFGENMQFLRTQPTKNLVRPAAHTHTRSYDFAFAPPTSFQLFVYLGLFEHRIIGRSRRQCSNITGEAGTLRTHYSNGTTATWAGTGMEPTLRG